MKKMTVFALAMVWAGIAAALEPWAMWTNFTGADAESGLAPQVSSTQHGIDGSNWRFKLAGNASVTNGVLSTGTGAAPCIDFGSEINLGYSNKPLTVVMAVRNVGTTLNKPLCMVGSTVGTALTAIDKTAGTASIKGIANNAVWNNTANEARSVNTLAGDDVTVLAMHYASGGVTVKTSTATTVNSLGTWSGLRSFSYNTQYIRFGNIADAESGGLDFELLAVAIYPATADNTTFTPTDADLTWLAWFTDDAVSKWFADDAVDTWLTDDDAVYTWQGTSTTFHSGPWKTTTRYAYTKDGGSSTTWGVFASSLEAYSAPGRILRFAPPSEKQASMPDRWMPPLPRFPWVA